MSSHDEANDASTLSIPDRVFISTGCFSLDISGRRLSSLKNVEWGGGGLGGGGAELTCQDSPALFIVCFFPPRFTCFFSCLISFSLSVPVVLAGLTPSPLHPSLHLFFHLIYLPFCCLLPLFPASPLWPLLQQPWQGRWERNQLKSMRGVD